MNPSCFYFPDEQMLSTVVAFRKWHYMDSVELESQYIAKVTLLQKKKLNAKSQRIRVTPMMKNCRIKCMITPIMAELVTKNVKSHRRQTKL